MQSHSFHTAQEPVKRYPAERDLFTASFRKKYRMIKRYNPPVFMMKGRRMKCSYKENGEKGRQIESKGTRIFSRSRMFFELGRIQEQGWRSMKSEPPSHPFGWGTFSNPRKVRIRFRFFHFLANNTKNAIKNVQFESQLMRVGPWVKPSSCNLSAYFLKF